MNPIKRMILAFTARQLTRWFSMESLLCRYPNSIAFAEGAPERTWPDPEKVAKGGEIPFSFLNVVTIGRPLESSIRQAVASVRSLDDNPSVPATTITPEALREFEARAKALGIGAIGYARLPRHLIFKHKAVLYDNVIVLLKEMDRDKIARAPSLSTFRMVFRTYDSLGKIVNVLTADLRKLGYGAQGGHPLGGLANYPPLAQLAGLGWVGRHGLLIAPGFGPRHRIGTIYTSIGNLPFAEENQYAWIGAFCDQCNACVHVCPAQAIRQQAIDHPSGGRTHIIRERCLRAFIDQLTCSICVKECPFATQDLANLRPS